MPEGAAGRCVPEWAAGGSVPERAACHVGLCPSGLLVGLCPSGLLVGLRPSGLLAFCQDLRVGSPGRRSRAGAPPGAAVAAATVSSGWGLGAPSPIPQTLPSGTTDGLPPHSFRDTRVSGRQAL